MTGLTREHKSVWKPDNLALKGDITLHDLYAQTLAWHLET